MRNLRSLPFRLFLYAALCMCPLLLGAQQADWVAAVEDSANTAGGTAFSVAMDSAGFIYSTGWYTGSADFDPGPDTFLLTSVSGNDIFIQKLDPQRRLVWVKTIGGMLPQNGMAIHADNQGNVYVTGSFESTVDFNPGPGVLNFVCPSASRSGFVLKVDAIGDMVWAFPIYPTSSNNVVGSDITTDQAGNVYVTGRFNGTVDFNPAAASFPLAAGSSDKCFVSKYDASGNFLWADAYTTTLTSVGYGIAVDKNGNVYAAGNRGVDEGFIRKYNAAGVLGWHRKIADCSVLSEGKCIAVDDQGNVYTSGGFYGTCDFDPGAGIFNLTAGAVTTPHIFVQKLNTQGSFVWAKAMGAYAPNHHFGARGIALDKQRNIYIGGSFLGTVDLDPDTNTAYNLTAQTLTGYIVKLNDMGNLQWAQAVSENGHCMVYSIAADTKVVCTSGYYKAPIDFNAGPGTLPIAAAAPVVGNCPFVHHMKQSGVIGNIFYDYNENCAEDSNDLALANRRVLIIPGNYAAITNSAGIWQVNSLPAGTYTCIADSTGGWESTCPTITFTVVSTDTPVRVQSLGMVSTSACAVPHVSIYTPPLRLCGTNQVVHVEVSNLYSALPFPAGHVDVTLDSLLIPFAASSPYSVEPNNTYRFPISALQTGERVRIQLRCSVSCNAVVGETLCMQANVFPVDSCVFDTIVTPYPPGNVSACTTPWDRSSVQVRGSCVNDSIRFVIANTGSRFGNTANMTCYAPVRIYIDGRFTLLDSVLLAAGDSAVFTFMADGRTWRVEADQHPLHPGNSHPNFTIEACGDAANWTPGLVTILPPDDADPVVDIFCTQVISSFDTNDKTGYPLGVGSSHSIAPNGQMQYVVRFQNTGTDTAFMVIVRDTVDEGFDILSVTPGVASHAYHFYIEGRMLEWRFYNILLPDSNTDLQGSQGFFTYTVNQTAGLQKGTTLKNSAAIYFDYNAPVITNETMHTIDLLQTPAWDAVDTLNVKKCYSFVYNGVNYSASGTYFQMQETQPGHDTVLVINVAIDTVHTDTTLVTTACNLFSINGQTYTETGIYPQTLVNAGGCDSLIQLHLTINTLNADIMQMDSFLTGVDTGAAFQWILCDGTVLNGENASTFYPTTTGDYAAVVSKNGCMDTSACYTFVVTGIAPGSHQQVIVFPQPAHTHLTVATPETLTGSAYSIVDPLGKQVLTGTLNKEITHIPIGALESGAYLLVLNGNLSKRIFVLKD